MGTLFSSPRKITIRRPAPQLQGRGLQCCGD